MECPQHLERAQLLARADTEDTEAGRPHTLLLTPEGDIECVRYYVCVCVFCVDPVLTIHKIKIRSDTTSYQSCPPLINRLGFI